VSYSGYRRKKRTRRAAQARDKAEKCATPWCRNRKAEKTTHYTNASGKIIVYKSYLPYCWKCKSRRLKEKHPRTYVFNMLRQRAKQRKMPWTVTSAQFKEFCDRTHYIELRGCGKGYYTIDRIDSNRGYHANNIQMLEFLDNCSEGADNTPRSERGAETTEQPF